MRLLSTIGGYLLKPPAQKAATKHWLKLDTKSAAPNARAPDDLYLVATLLGGGADACLLSARPAAASKDEAAVDEAAALGQGQRRLQSKAVSSNGLQAVFNQPFYVRTSSPQLTVLHVAVHAAAHGVGGDELGVGVVLQLGLVRALVVRLAARGALLRGGGERGMRRLAHAEQLRRVGRGEQEAIRHGVHAVRLGVLGLELLEHLAREHGRTQEVCLAMVRARWRHSRW